MWDTLCFLILIGDSRHHSFNHERKTAESIWKQAKSRSACFSIHFNEHDNKKRELVQFHTEWEIGRAFDLRKKSSNAPFEVLPIAETFHQTYITCQQLGHAHARGNHVG